MYESITNEAVFVARASEGAIQLEWLIEQPVSIRKRYVEDFKKELKDREEQLSRNKK